jgi:hypothetical protein
MTDWRETIGTIWAYAADVWAYVADLFSTPERATALFTAVLAVSTIFLSEPSYPVLRAHKSGSHSRT